MKTYGTKRILPVYGDSRPIERRINNVKIAGWKEQSFNATLVSQNDTYNDSAFLKIYGKSEQVQTTQGKNLFDAYNYVTSYPDDIKPVNQDGEDWIKMQSSTKQARYNFNAKENTQYTFTFEFKRYDDSGSYSANFVLYYTDGTSETLDFGYYGDGILHKVSKTSAQNKTISYIRNANNGNTVYFLLRVNGSQIEEGITATAYSPFVPNSPSPDYPSDIESVNGYITVTSTGINRTNYNDWIIIGGGTVSKSNNQVIFTTNTRCYGVMDIERILKPNTTYTAYCDYTFTGTFGSQWGIRTQINGTWGVPSQSNIKTFTTDSTGKVRVAFYVGMPYTTASHVLTLSNIRVYEGTYTLSTIPAGYEPYISNTTNIPLLHPLRSLPNGVADRIYYSNGKWYDEQKIETITLNGNNISWTYQAPVVSTNYAYFWGQLTSATKILGQNYVSNKLVCATTTVGSSYVAITDTIGRGEDGNSNNIRLYILSSRLSSNTVAALNTWLTNALPEVQYELATPIITEITDTNTIEALENINTYYPYTQIYTNAEIQPTLEGSLKIIDRGGSL